VTLAHQFRSTDQKRQLRPIEVEAIRLAYTQIPALEWHRVPDILAITQQIQLGNRKRPLLEHLDQCFAYQADRTYDRNTDTCGHRHLHALRTGTVAKWQTTATSAAERHIA